MIEDTEAPAAPASVPAPARKDGWRPLRYTLRLPVLAWHLLIHLPLTLLAINPLFARIRLGGERWDHRAIRWWSGGLMRVFGFRVRRYGQPLPGACFVVANHASWLDIELVHSQRMVHFVAKSEISRWPLVGWLASRAGTIYHRRGSTESLDRIGEIMIERLRAGYAVAVFAEGGTSPTLNVRTFHARVFQTPRDAGVPIQPVALNYRRAGQPDHSVCFRAGESFFGNFWRLLGDPSRQAEVHFLPTVTDHGGGRRELAVAARGAIMQAMGQTP